MPGRRTTGRQSSESAWVRRPRWQRQHLRSLRPMKSSFALLRGFTTRRAVARVIQTNDYAPLHAMPFPASSSAFKFCKPLSHPICTSASQQILGKQLLHSFVLTSRGIACGSIASCAKPVQYVRESSKAEGNDSHRGKQGNEENQPFTLTLGSSTLGISQQ